MNRLGNSELPGLKITRAPSSNLEMRRLSSSSINILKMVESHEITLPTRNLSPTSQSDLSFVARDSNHRFIGSQETSLNGSMIRSQSNHLSPMIPETKEFKYNRLDKIRKSLQITTNFNASPISLDPRSRRGSIQSVALDLSHVQSLKSSFAKNDLTVSIATGILHPPLKIELPASNMTPMSSALLKIPYGGNTGQNTTSVTSSLLKKPSYTSSDKIGASNSPENRTIHTQIIDVSQDHYRTTKALEEFITNPEEIKLIDDYIVELLGIRYQKDSTMRMKGGKDAQRRLKYMRELVLSLENHLRRRIILTILRFKKNVRRNLQMHKVVPIIEDLTDILFITIEINDLKLFLKTMHLIAETYAMFGDVTNSIFVYNQLRLACELCNNLNVKIDALIGLGDITKKIGHLDLSLIFIRRALQYAWYINNTTKELLLYDRLGLINYHIGDMERANFYHEKSIETYGVQDKNLLELSKIQIEQYKEVHHANYNEITTTFFAKLSLPSKKLASSPNTRDFNISLHPTTLTPGNNTAQSTKTKKKTDEFFPDEEIQKRATRFSTPFLLDVLLEKLLEEPEFDRVIPSPRSIKQKHDNEDIHFLNTKYHRNDDNMIKRKLLSINENTKQKTNEYSFKALFGDRPPYKDYKIKIDKMLERKDKYVDFWTLKNRLLTEYKTNPLNGRHFFSHLSPNRDIQGFKNASDYNHSRFMNFCKEFIDILVKIKMNLREESPLLKKIRNLLHAE